MLQTEGFSLENYEDSWILSLRDMPILEFYPIPNSGEFDITYYSDSVKSMFQAHIAEHPTIRIGDNIITVTTQLFLWILVKSYNDN